MTHQTSEEKAKPFRLVKYFTFTSLIVIFMGALVLSVLNTHLARGVVLKKSEDYALLLVENLNHQVYLQFILPVGMIIGKIQLRKQEQYDHLDKVIRTTIHSFKVDMVNIYDMDNNVIYSFDQKMVGRKKISGEDYHNAVSGKSVSRMVSGKLITFAPLREEKYSFKLTDLSLEKLKEKGIPENIFSKLKKLKHQEYLSEKKFVNDLKTEIGKDQFVQYKSLIFKYALIYISDRVLGVFEIVQDLSDDYEEISTFQKRVIITCAIVMSIIFLMLRFLVNRGEGIIRRRNLERIRLREQLNRAKHMSSLGKMVAGISHEIRNPLGIIRSSAELLKKKMVKFDPSNTIPDIIVEEANRLNNIITDFLDYAKPKNPNLAPCRIDDIIEKNITFLKSQIQDRGYAVQQYYDINELPEIMADSNMMYQAFLNIFINAMQSMPDGGKIQVKITSGHNIITISFKDEGKGVSEEVMEKIWNPFFTTKETGTGLGLGIVKNIIESHKGNIWIENSKSGQGAEVTVELPIRDMGI